MAGMTIQAQRLRDALIAAGFRHRTTRRQAGPISHAEFFVKTDRHRHRDQRTGQRYTEY